MIDYINCDDDCRVRILMDYFGERDPLPCGYCDYCLSHKSGKLTYRLIHDITEEILSRGEEGIGRDELKQLFPTLGRKEWKYTLNFLSSQGYTVDSSQDKIILNNQ